MDAMIVQPSLEDIYALAGQVRDYPVSVEELVDIARRSGASEEVISFYDSFMPWMTFHSQDELLGCSEQVDIMRAERSEMPREEELSPEEY